MNHEPGPEHDPVRRRGRPSTASGQAGGCCRDRAGRPTTLPAVVATGHLPAHACATSSGSAGSTPRDVGLDVQRHRGHRQHPAAGAEQPPDPVEAGDRVAEQLPQRDDQQVADRVAGAARPRWRSGAGARRARSGPTRCRRTARPAPSAGRPAAGRRTRRAAGRDEPPSSATVDDGGERVGQAPQRRQGRGQAVPAAERDDRRAGATGVPAAGTAGTAAVRRHSRPRSRWTTTRRRPAPRSRAASASAIATDAVLAAGAADADRDVALALAQVARPATARAVAAYRSRNSSAPSARQHVVARPAASRPGQGPQLGHPERVGQEPHVDDEVGVERAGRT